MSTAKLDRFRVRLEAEAVLPRFGRRRVRERLKHDLPETTGEPVREDRAHGEVDERPAILSPGGLISPGQERLRLARVLLVGPRLARLGVGDVLADVFLLRLELEHPPEQADLLVASTDDAVGIGELLHRVGVLGREVERPLVHRDRVRPVPELEVLACRVAESAGFIRVHRQQAIDPSRCGRGVAARDREVDPARDAGVVEAKRRVPLLHLVGFGRSVLTAKGVHHRADEPDAARSPVERAPEEDERRLVEAGLGVEVVARERGSDVVRIERENAIVEGDRVSPVRAAARVSGLREKNIHALVHRRLRGCAAGCLLDPGRALVAPLRQLTGEEQALHGRRLRRSLGRELARDVLARVISLREQEVARVGLERRRVARLGRALERLQRALDATTTRRCDLGRQLLGRGALAELRVQLAYGVVVRLQIGVGRAVRPGETQR